MNKLALLAILDSLVESKFNSFLEEAPNMRGPRGLRGKTGQGFIFEDHKDDISNIIDLFIENKKDLLKLKFDDLSEQDIDELKLKFSDLSDNDILSLRGPQGPRGKPGKSSNYEDFKSDLYDKLNDIYDSSKESLKLKFSDLSDDERNDLRGPRGQRGKPGKAALYEEFKDDLYNKLNEIYNTSKDSLKLRFSDLTEAEKDLITMKFDHLTDDQILDLRGPRGQRGKPGKVGNQGEKGEKGDKGDNGLMGPIGLPGQEGPRGYRGFSGTDGLDAPHIIDIEVETINNQMYFVFYFSDGGVIESNRVDLPEITRIFSNAVAYAVGGSLSGTTLKIEKDGIEIGEAEIINFEGDNITVTYDNIEKRVNVSVEHEDTCIPIFDEGALITDCAKSINFVGDLVQVCNDTVMSDWVLLSDVEPSLSAYEVDNPGNIVVKIQEPDPSNIIIKNVVCESDVFIGAAVRMNPSEVAVNALADSAANSNVLGLVENKVSTTVCDIRVSGVSTSNYVGLDVTKEYYLSATVPGGISTSVPTTTGHVKLKIGQPFSNSRMLVLKGEMTIRG